MKNTAVKPVLRRRFKRLLSSCNEVLEDFELEEIHDFRLHIKKLTAFLWLLNGGKPRGRLKIKKPLHEFYHRVGNVRNLQLHRRQVGDLCKQLHLSPPAGYLQFLAQKEAAEKAAARNEALCLNLRKTLKKLSGAAPKKIPQAAVKNFLVVSLATVQNTVQQTAVGDDDLHELRKVFKRFLYVWPWIKAHARDGFLPPFLKKETCDKLAAALGDFMDSVFALRFFETSSYTASAEEIAVLQVLQAHTAADKKRQYDTVINDLRNLAGLDGTGRVPFHRRR